jgi:predicted RecA/RadA family phage recombinase
MKNQVQEGRAINVTTPGGGYTAGNGYQVGASIFGVAALTTTSGQSNVLWVVGVYSLAKFATEVWAVGDEIYWNNGSQLCTNVLGSGHIKIGKAWAAAANPSSTGTVRLTDAG